MPVQSWVKADSGCRGGKMTLRWVGTSLRLGPLGLLGSALLFEHTYGGSGVSEPYEMTWVYRPTTNSASSDRDHQAVPVHGVSAPASDGRMQVVLANGDRVWASPRELVLELPSVPSDGLVGLAGPGRERPPGWQRRAASARRTRR